MKLSEIRAILDEVDAADAQVKENSIAGYANLEHIQRRNKAYMDFYNKMTLTLALVRQWLPVIEAAKALEIYMDDFGYLYPSQESLEKLTNLLEGIEE